jgi:hypothetical protein
MSIKICVISPISHLETYSPLGDIDMSLAHLVLENRGDNPYARYYRKQKEKGRFICLDNSLFELQKQGVGVGIDAVLEAAKITNPSEIIAEDVLYSSNDTIESTKEFIKTMKNRGMFGSYQIMGVVQGRTKEEWWKCFKDLTQLPINTIGLSKLSVPMAFLGVTAEEGCVARARLECTKLIEQEYGCQAVSNSIANGKQIHLLGGDNWAVWEMTQQKKYSWVRSNDSSCAVWYGRHGLVFNEKGKIDSFLREAPDLENYNPETSEALSNVQVQSCIYQNIAKWHLATKS